MLGLSPIHLLILLLIVVLIVGTKKLRNVGSDLGNAVRGFKEGMQGDGHADKDVAAGRTLEGEVKKDNAKHDV